MNRSDIYLWSRRTLFIGGDGFYWKEVNSAASILVISLQQEMTLLTPHAPHHVRSRSFLAPAGCQVSGYCSGPVACLFLDPLLEHDFRPLQKLMHTRVGKIWSGCQLEQNQIEAIRTIWEQQLSPSLAYALLCEQVLSPCVHHLNQSNIDWRIARVIHSLKEKPCSNIPNQVLAQQVGLSSSRLQRLFKEATGIPIRRYRLWHRLFVASTLISIGRPMTEAAVEAGFCDSAHFNHTFQSMLGQNPSTLLRGKRRATIRVGGDPT